MGLAGGTTGFTISSATTTISVALGGTTGLTKAGTGKLVLTGANTYSGTTAVNTGTLAFNGVTLSAGSPLDIASGAVVESYGTMSLSVNTTGTAIDVLGGGALRLASTTNNTSIPDLYFGPDHVSNSDWSARLSSSLDLGSLHRYIFGKTGHNGVGPYGLTGADCQFGGTISGTGGLTFIAQNNWTASGPMEVPFALNAANTFTGPVEIRRGSVYLGNPNALVRTNALTFSAASGHNARFFLYGNNAVISDLASTGVGTALIANGNLKSGASVTLGTATLTVAENNDTAFGGTITDVFPEYTGSGTGTTGPLNLLKNGPGRLTLTGASAYSGTTTISSGTLQVDGALGVTVLTVQNSGTLAGSGAINGPVSVQVGGTLAPGANAIGTLSINNSLNLAGSVVIELAKTGTTLSSDQIIGVSLCNYGGSLFVTNIGDIRAGTLAAGETFKLFAASNYAGDFASLTLPPLDAGLVWDTSNLNVDGSITVIATEGPPVITRQPQSLTVNPSNPATFAVIAAGPRPFDYQWQKNGSPLGAAKASNYNIASASTNDSGDYQVVVTNAYGTSTSAVATLTVVPAVPSSITNGLLVYLNFDNNINAQAGTTNNGSLYMGGATLGPRYIAGMIGQAANFANAATSGQPNDWAISLANLDWLYANSFSVSLWERTATTGDGALMGNKDWTSGANVGWVISSLDPKNLNYNAVGGTRRDIGLNPPFSDGNWHLITVTFDRGANQVISYVDGVPANTSDISPSGVASLNAGFNTLIGGSGNGTYSSTADIDDLGIGGRVLTAEEVSGIFGAAINNKPLSESVPGQAPLISAQPLDVNVSAGSTATFSVSASGPGTLHYQWKLNGTNIIGATNSTLTILSVTAASQGVYTVVVSNGAGAIVSGGAVLTVYQLAVTGQWDFDSGDLRATVGADLEFVNDTATLTAFSWANIDGQTGGVMGFGANSQSQGFYMRHGAKPNGGGEFVNQYTLIMDVMYPGPSGSSWGALFQTDPFNHSENDAEFYLGNNTSSPDPNGLGAEGQYNSSLMPDTWYRIAFAVDLTAPAGQQLVKYVNGVQVGSQSLAGGTEGRYALGPTALLFTSGLSSCSFARRGFANSIQFINGRMSASAIAALGGPKAKGLPPGNAALQIVGVAQNASVLNLTWTGPDGPFQLQRSSSMTNPVWQDVGVLNTNRNLSVLVSGATAFYRVKQFRPDIQVGQLPNGEQSLPSKQILRAAGRQLQFGGRPVDLALSPDGRTVFIKNINNLLVVDVATWRLVQTLNYPGSGASMHGIAVDPNGSHVYVTGAGNEFYDWAIGTNQTISLSRTIAMPGGSDPCGIAVSADGSKAYVCLSTLNRLAVVDLLTGSVTRQINVGIAPWDVVLSPDGAKAYVSDWGGRFPQAGDLTAPSAGTAVVVDNRGVASSGIISFVDLGSGLETGQMPTGLHASDIELSPDGSTLYVAKCQLGHSDGDRYPDEGRERNYSGASGPNIPLWQRVGWTGVEQGWEKPVRRQRRE